MARGAYHAAARGQSTGRGRRQSDANAAARLAALLGRLGDARRLQGLVQIRDDIVDMLQPDGEPDIAVGDAGRELLVRRELGMRGGRRVDGEAPRIADMGDVIEELQGVDEAPPGLLAAGELEAQKPA